MLVMQVGSNQSLVWVVRDDLGWAELWLNRPIGSRTTTQSQDSCYHFIHIKWLTLTLHDFITSIILLSDVVERGIISEHVPQPHNPNLCSHIFFSTCSAFHCLVSGYITRGLYLQIVFLRYAYNALVCFYVFTFLGYQLYHCSSHRPSTSKCFNAICYRRLQWYL